MENTINEYIEMDAQDRTEVIKILCTMVRETPNTTFEFTQSIDEVGQLVLMPQDEACMFTKVEAYEGEDVNIETDLEKTFTIDVVAHMIADDDNFSWFTNVDEIGNIVITPESDTTTFISAAEDESNLNLVTDDNLNEALTSEQIKTLKEDSFKQIELLTEILKKIDQPLERLTDNVNRLNPVGLDFNTLVVSPIKKFEEGINSTTEVLNSMGENDEGGEKKVTESYRLNEGTWSMPKTLKDVKTLKSVLKSPITVDRVEEVKDILYPILGDDGVFDDLDDLEPGEDAVPLIKKYIKSLVNDLPDKFSSEVLDGLKSIVSGMTESISITEEVQDDALTFIAIIHIDDEDGAWCKITAPSKESAVEYLLSIMKQEHPEAKFIRVSIDDVVSTFGDISLVEDLGEGDIEIDTPEQEFSSAKTSINSTKLPAIFGMVDFAPDTLNLDYGGGKFDNATEALSHKQVTNVIYDPYNRTAEHNKEVLDIVRSNGGADTITCSNVLNVIKEPEVRLSVLNNMKKLIRPSGTVYITVYEGAGNGVGKVTASGYQLNKKTEDYLAEIKTVFPAAIRKGKLIIAKS